jgi:hypothetical protein
MNNLYCFLTFYVALCFFKPFRVLMGFLVGGVLHLVGVLILFVATVTAFLAGWFVGMGNYLRQGH